MPTWCKSRVAFWMTGQYCVIQTVTVRLAKVTSSQQNHNFQRNATLLPYFYWFFIFLNSKTQANKPKIKFVTNVWRRPAEKAPNVENSLRSPLSPKTDTRDSNTMYGDHYDRVFTGGSVGGIKWSFLLGLRCSWRHSMWLIQTNLLAELMTQTGIMFYTHYRR